MSSQLTDDGSNMIASTTVNCETSRLKFNSDRARFSDIFVNDLAAAIQPKLSTVNPDSVWDNLVQKYGTHYYQTATLGGKLQMFSSITKSHYFSQTQTETTFSLDASLSAKVSSKAGSVGGGVTGGVANTGEVTLRHIA